MKKEFLTATGDGKHTIRGVDEEGAALILQLKALEEIHGESLNEVLPTGEKRVLVPYGNHARGACFWMTRISIDEQLTETIDRICKTIKGFYFGRLDIRYNDWQELKEGKNLMIIEVNGAGSEPTHIYDPGHSLFFAWKEIIRHWKILYPGEPCEPSQRNSIPYFQPGNSDV